MYPQAPADVALSDPRFSDGSILVVTTPSTLRETTDEHRERLRVGFEFNRQFIVTYQAAVAGILLVIVVQRGIQKWRHHRRRQSRQAEHLCRAVNTEDGSKATQDNVNNRPSEIDHLSSASSCSSSYGTIHAEPENKKGIRESSRALLTNDFEAQANANPRPNHILAELQACLMYQPQPLPWFHRTMPTVGSCLGVLALLGLNVFYLTFNCIDQFDILASRAGLLFVANLPWLYMFAAKNQPIKLITGYSYENLNLLHRRLGEWMCLLALIHGMGLIYAWYSFLRPLGFTLWHFLTVRYIMFGIGAFFAYEALYFTSLSSFRTWWYEVFLGSHIFFQIAALVLLWLHHYNSKPYIAVSLAIFLIDRILYRLILKTRTFRAQVSVLEDGNTTLIDVAVPVGATGPVRSLRRAFNLSVRQGWLPSHHIFITVPALSGKHALQSHPITIASAAPSSLVSQQDTQTVPLRLLIRAQGGFSRDLLNFARENVTTTVRLDGPYGSMHAVEMLQAADRAIVVAGGSGIAVAKPMLWALIEARVHASNADHRADNASYVSTPPKEITLIWIVQEASHTTWLDPADLDALQKHGVQVVIPAPTRVAGRPDVELLLHEALSSTQHEDFARGPGHDEIAVVVSGPDGLNRSVRNSCARLRRCGMNISVAVEKFGW